MKLLPKLSFTIVFLFLLLLIPHSPVNASQPPPIEETIEAEVTKIIEQKEIQPQGQINKQLYQKLELILTSGETKGKSIIIQNGDIPSLNIREYKVGDKLIITSTQNIQGENIYYITDYVRRDPLYWLFFIFLALTVIIGRKRGIASISGMALSFFVIFNFVLPQILAGRDPVVIAITASIILIPITFYLSHGLNSKTTSAILGTVIALIITGFLASFFVEAAKLTGFASEEAGFLQTMKQGAINIKGLLLAGIIIGVLGILDDITITQAAIVQQLKQTTPNLSIKDLYYKAMDIGRDHIASMVNTLVLVYTGAALPLLLLFVDNPHPFSQVINYEIIAEEIIRTLVATTGLILAVPITSLITAILTNQTSSSTKTPTKPNKFKNKSKLA